MFEDRILGLTNTRYRKLKRPAELAAEKPDTCVKILNKSAYYVIKDCAEITLKYLPHFIYSGIKDPIAKLRGNVPEQDIVDFVSRASKADHTQQLLRLVVDDIIKSDKDTSEIPTTSHSPVDFTLTGNEDDVYGDYEYGFDSDPEPEPELKSVTMANVNINDTNEIVELLKEALV